MDNNIIYSIIIPQRNSIDTLPRLFESIPERADIEIIVVDNTPMPLTKEEIGIARDYQLLWSSPERHAGGARNVGVENAHGKWLIFADADDFFSDFAFQKFDEYKYSKSDIIYFCVDGVYSDSGEHSERGDTFTNLVRGYLCGICSEEDLKFGYCVPWGKMVSHELVNRHNLKYDEIRAGNDIYFSTISGYYAKNIEAVDSISYIVTVSKGSLTKRRDCEVTKARLYASLRRNLFLKEHGYSHKQSSIGVYLYEARNYGIKVFFEFMGMVIRYKQNPFIGCTRWIATFFSKKKEDSRDAKYIVR